jgi:hypothetical protein
MFPVCPPKYTAIFHVEATLNKNHEVLTGSLKREDDVGLGAPT